MLDELRELEVCTSDADAFPEHGCLIRPAGKGKSTFTGVPRALELIARQALFFDGTSWEEAAARANTALDALRAWCDPADRSAAAPVVPDLERCSGWMERYIRAYCKRFPDFDEDKLLKAWRDRRPDYEEGMFTQRSLTASDFNAVSFQATVARALRKGPLRRWCMVGSLVPDEVCTTTKKKGDGSYAKLSARNTPTVIALTALCLMALDRSGGVPRTGFAPISLLELGTLRGRAKEFDHRIIESWLYKGEQLFTQGSEESGVKPYRISQAWLDDGQWQLINITDGTATLERFQQSHAGQGFRCYRDAAYNEPGFTMDASWGLLVSTACDGADV